MSPKEARLSLEWLIHPISTQEFFAEYWERRPLVVKRRQTGYFGSLTSLEEIDRVLTTQDLRYPNITLKNADGSVSAEDYTVEGDCLDVAKAYQLFEKGSTIVLAFLDAVIPALGAFCRNLEREFSFPCQANLYLTPPGAKGARYHYDTHDVFVLQVTNSKRWTTYGTPLELPLRAQDFDSSIHDRGEPTMQFELEAGDVAYVPRGLVHDARSGDEISLHITAGILSYTWADLLMEWTAEASLNDAAFRRSLPPGFARQDFDRAEAREIFGKLVERLRARTNVEPILDRFVDQFIASRAPLLEGQMAQLAGLGGLNIDSVAGARQDSMAFVRTGGETVTVDCHGRTITFPRHAAEAIRYALNHSRFLVRELPGGLDDAGKLTLLRRLVREGLVMVQEK